MIDPKEMQYADKVKLDYTEGDLEDEDLGMSGIVLSSPLAQFNDLRATFEYLGVFEFNAKTWCFIRAESNQFNRGKERVYMVQQSYLKKA